MKATNLRVAMFCACAMTAVLASGGAWAGQDDHQTLASAAAPAVEPSKPTSSEQVCRKMPAPTGTRLGGRTICHTQAEWDDMKLKSQHTVDDIQTRSGQFGPQGG